jgi:hypothetical protein
MHHASCGCGRLRATASGPPLWVSVCHCLACQQRTGGVFGVQARFKRSQVTITGESRQWERISDDGDSRVFHFCPTCGATVYYGMPSEADLVAIPVGAFADPAFPAPQRSVWEERKHDWVRIPTAEVHRP